MVLWLPFLLEIYAKLPEHCDEHVFIRGKFVFCNSEKINEYLKNQYILIVEEGYKQFMRGGSTGRSYKWAIYNCRQQKLAI